MAVQHMPNPISACIKALNLQRLAINTPLVMGLLDPIIGYLCVRGSSSSSSTSLQQSEEQTEICGAHLSGWRIML